MSSRGYKEHRRVELFDRSGATLSLIIETNGANWKLYAVHKENGQTSAEAAFSDWWAFTDRDRAVEKMMGKADEAAALGWELI